MKIVKRSIQVTEAVKNVGRLRTILGVFARHGLEDFLIRMGLEKYFNRGEKKAGIEHLNVAERLRLAFEELGPTFVKLGQLLSNRPDMVPDNFIEEFKKLQDHVAPVSFADIKGVLEDELEGSLSQYFDNFSEAPLASASIGQVHTATLKTGEHVVVKVQRPNIDRVIRSDISVLRFLASMMEKYLPETQFISPTQVVEEFFAVLNYELDFIVEANTTIKVAENFKDNSKIKIPRIYKNLSTQKVLVQERLYGISISNLDELNRSGISATELVDIGARAFFKMVMQDGLFHGDLHGGNLFAMKDPLSGQAVLGVIDFGIVGRLSPKSRDSFSRMMMALVTEDYETLCYEYAEMGAMRSGVDFDAFVRDVRNSLAPYMGLSLKDLKIGHVLINSTKIAVKYNIKVPSDWMVVFKAIFTMEGMGRQLDPDFDLISIGNDLLKVVLRDRISVPRLTKDFAWIVRDLHALLQVLPRQVRWMLRKFNANDFVIELKFKESEILRHQIERSSRGIGFSILIGSLFIAAMLSLNFDRGYLVYDVYPIHSVVLFALGAVGFLRLLLRGWK